MVALAGTLYHISVLMFLSFSRCCNVLLWFVLFLFLWCVNGSTSPCNYMCWRLYNAIKLAVAQCSRECRTVVLVKPSLTPSTYSSGGLFIHVAHLENAKFRHWQGLQPTVRTHISRTVSSCLYAMCQICSICQSHRPVLLLMNTSLVLSWHDYGSTTSLYCPDTNLTIYRECSHRTY